MIIMTRSYTNFNYVNVNGLKFRFLGNKLMDAVIAPFHDFTKFSSHAWINWPSFRRADFI